MTVYLITFYYDQIVIWRCDGSRIFAWSTLGLAIHQWYRRWMLQKVATWPSHYISDGNIAILLTGSHRTNTKYTIFNCVRHINARCIDQIKDILRVGNTCTRGCVWIGSLGTWYATISALNARDLREKANAILRWGQWDMRRVVKRFLCA